MTPWAYGLTNFGDLYTHRQLTALCTLSELVGEVIARCRADALAAGMTDGESGLETIEVSALAYAHLIEYLKKILTT